LNSINNLTKNIIFLKEIKKIPSNYIDVNLMEREKLLEKNKIIKFKNVQIDFRKILQIYL